MAEKIKVIININNQEYTVVSMESEEYIKKIAKIVDENIKEILSKNWKLSNSMAAVLAAFNMTDRYYEKTQKLDEMKESVLGPLKELDEVKDKLREYEESEKTMKKESSETIETLSSENKNMKKELEKLKREVENLDKKNKKNENAIEIKENDLANNQKVINDLQDKIFEHQMEIMQTKKQLDESLKRSDDK